MKYFLLKVVAVGEVVAGVMFFMNSATDIQLGFGLVLVFGGISQYIASTK